MKTIIKQQILPRVGDHVYGSPGIRHSLDGFIVGILTNREGSVRIVVEDKSGRLEIYKPSDLVRVTTDNRQAETRVEAYDKDIPQ